MYYVAINQYASETSMGFANTWQVAGFATKLERDQYVNKATDLATKAIKAKEVNRYGGLQIMYDRNGDRYINTSSLLTIREWIPDVMYNPKEL